MISHLLTGEEMSISKVPISFSLAILMLVKMMERMHTIIHMTPGTMNSALRMAGL